MCGTVPQCTHAHRHMRAHTRTPQVYKPLSTVPDANVQQRLIMIIFIKLKMSDLIIQPSNWFIA